MLPLDFPRRPTAAAADAFRPTGHDAASAGRPSLPDILIALAIAGAAAMLTAWLFRSLDPRLLIWPDGNDVWFEGDLPAVFRNLLDRFSDQSRNGDHPLFPLLATIPVTTLHHLGAPAGAPVAIFLAAVAGIWGALVYAVLRLCTRRLDAVIFTVAGGSTAAALFWLPVPECAGVASVTILAALAAAAMADRGRLPAPALVGVSALTLSATVTHWWAGLLLAFARHRPARALQLSVNALALVVLLWSVQRAVVPTADFFVGYTAHAKFILRPEAGGPRRVWTTLLLHGAVMPLPAVRHERKWGSVMTIQHDGVGSGGAVADVARAAWIGLLLLGVAGMRRASRTLRVVVLGTLAGQLALHSVYGEETFLYSLSAMPLLLTIAAHGTRTRARPVALLLAVVFIVTAGRTNLARFGDANRFPASGHTTATSGPDAGTASR